MSASIRTRMTDFLMYVVSLTSRVPTLRSLTLALVEPLDSVVASVVELRLMSPIRAGVVAPHAGTALDEHAVSATTSLTLLQGVLLVTTDAQTPRCHVLSTRMIEESTARLSSRLPHTGSADAVASSLEVELWLLR
jgi:hypothetical protein